MSTSPYSRPALFQSFSREPWSGCRLQFIFSSVSMERRVGTSVVDGFKFVSIERGFIPDHFQKF